MLSKKRKLLNSMVSVSVFNPYIPMFAHTQKGSTYNNMLKEISSGQRIMIFFLFDHLDLFCFLVFQH